MTNPARPDGPAADPRHLLVIGAGPGLGGALAHRFAQGGYHLTLLARHTDGLAKLASDLAHAGAAAGTVAADASDPQGLPPPSPRCTRAPARPGSWPATHRC
jgi:short-subunit dehydrogenase